MKPTQIAELFANIKSTIVSFFSIMMFVALGVGIFAGIHWMAPALQEAADSEFNKGSFHHFQLQFPYGLTDEDIEQVKALDGVEEVEGTRQSFQTVDTEWGSVTIKVHSMPQNINTLTVVEGSLPVNDSEIVVNEGIAEQLELEVGDTVTFAPDKQGDSATTIEQSSDGEEDADSDPMQYLNGQTFKLAGIVRSPEYIAVSTTSFGFSFTGAGTVHGLAWVPLSAFDAKAFHDGWPVVNVRASSLDSLNTFRGEYDAVSSELGDRITELGKGLADARFRTLHDDAQAVIDDGEKQLKDAQTKISDGEEQLANGKKEIADGEEKIKTGEEELEAGWAQIAEGEQKLADGYAEYEQKAAEGKAKLDEAHATLSKYESEYNAAKAELDEAKSDSEQVRDAYEAAKESVDAAQAALEDLGKAEADNAAKLAAGTIKQEEFWAAVMPYYQNLVTSYTDANANLEVLNVEIEEAGEKYPDEEIEGAYPLLCELPELPEALGDNDFETLLAQLDDAVAQATESMTTLRTTPISVGGEPVVFDAAPVLGEIINATITSSEEMLESKKSELDKGEAQYNEKKAEYESLLAEGQAKLADGEAQLAAAKEEAAAGEAELEEARTKLADAKKQLKEKTAELEDAKVQVKEKTSQLEDAKEQLGLMKEYEWVVAPRSLNGGVGEVTTLADIMHQLSLSMAALFVLVGLLVSYSAVSRIVHEQITQIGTKKALGLRTKEITLSFLLYAAIAVIAGSILGLLLGIFSVETIIGHTLAARFTMDNIPYYLDAAVGLGITGAELVLVLGATWFACHTILREQAVELLKGEKPPEGKTRFFEKWKVWEGLPLYTQTIVNNCLNDKRRVFSTIVGVAGCAALVVTAVTLNDDVLTSYDKQYECVYKFNTIAYIDNEVEGVVEAATDAFAQEGCASTPVLRKTQALELPTGDRGVSRLVVPADEEEFLQRYHVNVLEGAECDLSGDGVWMSVAYASHLGAKVGDEVVVNSSDGAVYRLKIAGFYDFYLAYNEMIIGKDTYERVFGTEFKPNILLVDTNGKDIQDVVEAMPEVSGIQQIDDDKYNQHGTFLSFAKISRTVVLVYLVLALLMAIVVLLNLNVMFIEEKKRELIVLMINGFSVKDAKRYIYNDTILLTIIGIAIGLVLGALMGSWTVASVEPPTASFYKGLDPLALLAATGVCVVLSFVMSKIALRRIPAFNLTDINKF